MTPWESRCNPEESSEKFWSTLNQTRFEAIEESWWMVVSVVDISPSGCGCFEEGLQEARHSVAFARLPVLACQHTKPRQARHMNSCSLSCYVSIPV